MWTCQYRPMTLFMRWLEITSWCILCSELSGAKLVNCLSKLNRNGFYQIPLLLVTMWTFSWPCSASAEEARKLYQWSQDEWWPLAGTSLCFSHFLGFSAHNSYFYTFCQRLLYYNSTLNLPYPESNVFPSFPVCLFVCCFKYYHYLLWLGQACSHLFFLSSPPPFF